MNEYRPITSDDHDHASFVSTTDVAEPLPAIMRKTFKQLIIFFGLLSFCSCEAQDKIIYHNFSETASDFKIEKWNIKNVKEYDLILSEKYDSKNRVIELKFYSQKGNNVGTLCYLSNWIKYEYPDNFTIVQYNLNSDGKAEANIECEVPSKITYTLSENQNKIIKTSAEYKFDRNHYKKIGWTEQYIDNIVNQLKSEQDTAFIVDYFSKSLKKLNGIFPTSNEFQLNSFHFSELEKEKVIESINNGR